MADRCPTDVYYEFHGMGTDKLQLRPCALLGWAYCNGYCNSCRATVTEHTPYDPIEIARQYAPKFDKPVVDMVAVVRCRDCKYCLIHDKILFCEYMGSIGEWRFRTKTDYCSRGEREEVEE